jgi:thymidylate synthase
MQQYLDLLRRVRDEGVRKSNRTGIDTFGLVGAMLDFDLSLGFPAVTTKKLAFNQVKGELIGFIRGFTDAEQFRSLGCNVWDQNANQNQQWLANTSRQGEDDLGRIYGAQWRSWIGMSKNHGFAIVDQLENCVKTVLNDHTSRRNLVTAWNPAELDQMALPPCHVLFQLHVNKEEGTLSMTMYQRSCDLFLGVPFNIASYALLLHLIATVTGYKAGRLIMFLADVHIYENHLEQVAKQLSRSPCSLPELVLKREDFDWNISPFGRLQVIMPSSISLHNYNHHPAITAPMAV